MIKLSYYTGYLEVMEKLASKNSHLKSAIDKLRNNLSKAKGADEVEEIIFNSLDDSGYLKDRLKHKVNQFQPQKHTPDSSPTDLFNDYYKIQKEKAMDAFNYQRPKKDNIVKKVKWY